MNENLFSNNLGNNISLVDNIVDNFSSDDISHIVSLYLPKILAVSNLDSEWESIISSFIQTFLSQDLEKLNTLPKTLVKLLKNKQVPTNLEDIFDYLINNFLKKGITFKNPPTEINTDREIYISCSLEDMYSGNIKWIKLENDEFPIECHKKINTFENIVFKCQAEAANFKIIEENLEMTKLITVYDLLTGFDLEIELPNEDIIEITIEPKTDIVGFNYVIPEYGMIKENEIRGNLIVCFRIEKYENKYDHRRELLEIFGTSIPS